MIRRFINRILGKKKQQAPLIPKNSFTGFIREISPNDSMFQSDNLYYFYWGKWALDCVEKTLKKAGKRKIEKILDFPCGHGRALRFFKTAFPEATLTACDIEKDGVDFCVKTFGAKGVYSSKNPSELSIEEKFDLIWCGSLLTHLNQNKWREFLGVFDKHLKNNGVLIFTTHGDCIANSLRKGKENLGLKKGAIAQLLLDYQKIGFGYTGYIGQNNYGVSLSQSGWVIEFLKEFSNLQLIEHNPKGWGSKKFSQDSFALIRKE